MTKSRKRMLISSIAMLLVALVALGSATYAWFSVSKTVNANNMVVKAIAAAGLEISKTSATESFNTTQSFGQADDTATQLKPVSWDGVTTDGFIPDGNVESPGGAYTGSFKAVTITPSTGSQPETSAYVAKYDVWVRSADEGGSRTAHTVSAKVKITGDNASFARVKLVDNNTTKGIYANEADASASVVKAEGSTTATYALAAQNTPVSVTGTDTTATGKPFSLYVWFDGQDADCIDTAKNNTATVEIEFTATDM